MKTLLVLFAMSLAACQQIARAPVTTTTPTAPIVQTKSVSTTAPAWGAAVQEWTLSVSAGPNETYLIHIADAQGKELQVLEGPGGDVPLDASGLLRLEDFTGDGKVDILARGLSAGASALTSEIIYAYDPQARRFMNAENFENEGEVSKTSAGCIAVEHRNADNMTYAKDHYCWDGGKWTFKGSKQ